MSDDVEASTAQASAAGREATGDRSEYLHIGEVERTVDGRPERWNLWLCGRCGAAVGWLNTHDAFHRQQEPAASGEGSGT